MKDRPRKWTSKDLCALLRVRHPKDAWALMFEVRSETGFNGHGRSADAIAMSLWPSRGLEVHGFEIKVSRSDWRREIERPEKAEPIARYCDRWWLVVSDPKIVQQGELPPTWGLLAPDSKGSALKVVTQAPKLKPIDLGRGFVASALRAAQAQLTPDAELEKIRSEAWEKGHEAGVSRAEERIGYEFTQLKKAVATFEKSAGIEIRRWAAGDIGAAVRLVMSDGGYNGVSFRMQQVEKALRSALEAVEQATGADKVTTPLAP